MRMIAAGVFIAVIGALGLVSTASAQAEARIRVLHASPDAPAVDVYLDGSEAISDLAFDEITDYVSVPSGSHTVEVFPAAADGTGDAVITADVTLSADTDYTVAAVGALADIEPLVLVDDNSAPPAGQARVRFVHASPDAPAVDIFAEGVGVIISGAAFKDASEYLTVPALTYNLEVRAAGTETAALALPGIALEGGNVYSAFAVGLLEGEPALSAKLTVDATFEPTPTPTPTPTLTPTPTVVPVTGGAGVPPAASSSWGVWLIAMAGGLAGVTVVAGVGGLVTGWIRRS
jgi:hypothetical protein